MPDLANKYRPKTFKQVKGNEQLVSIIRRTIRKDDKPQTYILQGERGCGKTTLARIMAKKFGAIGGDIHEINISDMRGIDTARELIMNVRLAPLHGGSKVIILNECHKATNEFQNAMLERLEEPPPNVYFILCTTEPGKLLKTVRSRCALSKFFVKPLPRRDMQKVVNVVLEAEGEEWKKQHVQKIVKMADGIPREALMLLDGVIGLRGKRLSKALEDIERQTKELPFELAKAINKKQPWKEVSRILKALEGEDVEGTRRVVLSYLYKVLRDNPNDYIAGCIECLEDNFYDSGMAGLVLACYKINQL